MTDEELYDLIDGDPTAKAMAQAGNDSGCAVRCMAIATPEHQPTVLTERGFFKAATPTVAASILAKLTTYAAQGDTYSPIVGKFLNWLTPANGGADFGDPDVLSLAGALAQGGVITSNEYTVITMLSLQPPTITGSDVSRVWRGAI
jgi:hypothetical protein